MEPGSLCRLHAAQGERDMRVFPLMLLPPGFTPLERRRPLMLTPCFTTSDMPSGATRGWKRCVHPETALGPKELTHDPTDL